VAIDGDGKEVAGTRVPLPEPRRDRGAVEQEPGEWWTALCAALDGLLAQLDRSRVRALAVDGTSGTVLLADPEGRPLAPALLYNDNRAVDEAARIRAVAPRESAAHGTSGGLAKALWLLARHPDAARLHTPADWLSARLTGRAGISDANNVLKLGWDPVARAWPAWIEQCLPRHLLPEIVAPGTSLGSLTPALAAHFGLPADTVVVAGTTDSTAAILATGARKVGEAVTSLGSTLVMKVIAAKPIFAPEYGLYSQPFGDHWLVGGGSNTGGAVLRHFFTPKELIRLEGQLDPDRPTGLDYYPLLAPGERFPVNDPALAPRLTPRPVSDAEFLQGLLEAMARIEAEAYRKLEALGAPHPSRVLSAGGGARNRAWTRIRARMLKRPVETPAHDEAAYGAALLARDIRVT
jgi:sugar (pentulose or hexulose) kinase